MENCLVTKLQSIVSNDSLKYLGKVSFPFEDNTFNANYYLQIIAAPGKTATVSLKNGYFLNSQGASTGNQSITVSSNDNWILLPTTADVFTIGDKYNVAKIISTHPNKSLFTLPLDDLHFCNNLSFISVRVVEGKIKNLPALKYFNASYISDGNPLSDFTNCPLLEELRITGSDIVGKFEDIGSLTHLTVVSFGVSYNVSGTVEAFVAAQRLAGRTSETEGIRLLYFNTTSITYNGSALPSIDMTLTWDINGNITLS